MDDKPINFFFSSSVVSFVYNLRHLSAVCVRLMSVYIVYALLLLLVEMRYTSCVYVLTSDRLLTCFIVETPVQWIVNEHPVSDLILLIRCILPLLICIYQHMHVNCVNLQVIHKCKFSYVFQR